MEIKIQQKKEGFTLVELLLAVAMISAILSMIYGTYLAASQSARKFREKISASHKASELIEQMSCQIRGSCIPWTGENDDISTSLKDSISESFAETSDSNNYFYGGSEFGNKEILHIVTTSVSPSIQGESLYEITYSFEKESGLLLLNRRKFYRRSEDHYANEKWGEVAENISSINFYFFNGQKWLPSWDFSEKKSLPRAVKIGITVTDSANQKYFYQTVITRESQNKFHNDNDFKTEHLENES